MATLHQQISERFLEKLAEYKDIDADKLDKLRLLLQNDKKPKPDDFLRIFKSSPGDLR